MKVVLSVVVIVLLATFAGAGTWAAYSATTQNTGNVLAAGSVQLDDNDADGFMLSLSNAEPGDSDTGCMEVTYNGTLPASVRLYGTTAGSGLDQYLNVTVTRGTLTSGDFNDCTGFAPDAADYIGAGAGIVYSGTLQDFPDSYAAGIVDQSGVATPESWITSETHGYRFHVELGNDSDGAGKTATQQFTWEARS